MHNRVLSAHTHTVLLPTDTVSSTDRALELTSTAKMLTIEQLLNDSFVPTPQPQATAFSSLSLYMKWTIVLYF